MDKKMFDLKMCLANDIRGMNWEEHDDMRGYILKSPGGKWSEYTIYCAENGYSSFVAVPDIFRGIDTEDEKPLAVSTSLFSAVSAIKAHQIANGSKDYDVAPPVNSNPQRAPHYVKD